MNPPFDFKPRKPHKSQHHAKIRIKYATVSDTEELIKRKNLELREWVLWAIDYGILSDKNGERLQVCDSNFDSFFHGDTPRLVRDEVYTRHVEPYLESKRSFATSLKSILEGTVGPDPNEVTDRLAKMNHDLTSFNVESPFPEIKEILHDVSSTLSDIHAETQASNRSNSRKWWIGFMALVVFTFFGVNIQNVLEWLRSIFFLLD